MPARFHIARTYALPSSDLFVFQGELRDGAIRPGMILGIPINSGVTVTLAIRGVEGVRDSTGGHTALTVQADAFERGMLEGLNAHNLTVDVTAPDE